MFISSTSYLFCLPHIYLFLLGIEPNFNPKGLGPSNGQGGGQGSGGVGSYKPPFKNVGIVYINIKASLFEVKKR